MIAQRFCHTETYTKITHAPVTHKCTIYKSNAIAKQTLKVLLGNLCVSFTTNRIICHSDELYETESIN
jgi:hypothetical protein